MSIDPLVLHFLSRPIVYRQPKRLLPPPSWSMHVPLAFWLVDVFRPRVVVELGTFSGTSYCAFCQAVKELELDTKCFAIDTWQGDPQSFMYGKEILIDLKHHHDPLYSAFSKLMCKDFDSAVADFRDSTIDLLHIDGYHTYEAVKHDFQTWLPKLSTRGLVLFHDTEVRRGDFGVFRFWEEIRNDYPSLQLSHGNGLGILLVGADVPAELKNFVRLVRNSGDNEGMFQRFFEHLGKACLQEVQLQIAAADMRNAKLAIENLRSEIQEAHRAWELRGGEIERLQEVELRLRSQLERPKQEAEVEPSSLYRQLKSGVTLIRCALDRIRGPR